MVIFCKRCGTPVKLDNARLSDPAYSVKCQECQRPVAVELSWHSPGGAGTTTSGAAAGASHSAAVPRSGAAMEVHTSAPDRTHFLQKVRLFSALPVEECLLIESRLRPREYAPQQTIVKEGGPGDAMFVINSGAVEVRKKDFNTGIDFLLSELKAGACFGEMALLTGKPRVASVVAMEPTSCSILDQSAFDEILLTSSKVGLALSRVLAERLDEANQQTGIEYINLSKMQFDGRIMRLLPQQMIQQHHVVPIAFSNNRLTLAMVNPNNLIALDDVRRVIKGVIIEPVATSEDDFKRFLTTTFTELLRKEDEKQAGAQGAAVPKPGTAGKSSDGSTSAPQGDTTKMILESLQCDALKSLEIDEGTLTSDSVKEIGGSAEEAPIIRMANSILALAIKKGASDIHVEP